MATTAALLAREDAWAALIVDGLFGLLIGQLLALPQQIFAEWSQSAGLVALGVMVGVAAYFIGPSWLDWMRECTITWHPGSFTACGP